MKIIKNWVDLNSGTTEVSLIHMYVAQARLTKDVFADLLEYRLRICTNVCISRTRSLKYQNRIVRLPFALVSS